MVVLILLLMIFQALVTFAEDKEEINYKDDSFLKSSISTPLDNNNSICSDVPSSPSYR